MGVPRYLLTPPNGSTLVLIDALRRVCAGEPRDRVLAGLPEQARQAVDGNDTAIADDVLLAVLRGDRAPDLTPAEYADTTTLTRFLYGPPARSIKQPARRHADPPTRSV